MSKETKLLSEPPEKWYLPARFVLASLLFCALVLEYAQRVCLSVTIVAMVNQTAFDSPNSTFDTDTTCGVGNETNAATTEKRGDYLWSPYVQGIVLGAYFYGYVCSQIIGGRISEMVGGKRPLGFAILLASLLTLATPSAAEIGVPAIVIVRALMGFAHGCCFPTAFAMLAQWAPPEEQNTLISICVIGGHVGTILTMPFAAYLCQHGFSGGWPSVYYTLGTIGCVWCILWVFLAHSTPSDHPRISQRELEYIQRGNTQMKADQKLPIPWKQILCSLRMWSAAFCMFTTAWSFLTLLTKLPTYLQVVLHISIQSNGLINSLIYICACISLFLAGYASDYFRTRKNYSSTKVRKSFQFFCMMGPAASMVLIPAMGCDQNLVIFLLTVAMFFQGFGGGGVNSITADMSPHHAATLFGFINSVASISGIFAPMIAGALLEKDHASIQQWGLVFYISAGLNVVGGIIFILFASAERQPWACVTVAKTDKVMSTKDKELLDISNEII